MTTLKKMFFIAAAITLAAGTFCNLKAADNKEKGEKMTRKVQAEFSMIFNGGKMPMTYFGWPTVAKLTDGRLIVGASGFRYSHLCPFGKTVILESKDDGKTWGEPKVLHNSMVDDRDVGITPLKDGGYLVSFFSIDIRKYIPDVKKNSPQQYEVWKNCTDAWKDEDVWKEIGSYIIPVAADGTVGKRMKVPVSAPHGPIQCGDELLYLGWPFAARAGSPKELVKDPMANGFLALYVSKDDGKTWTLRSKIPAQPLTIWEEPTVVQTPSGRLIAEIRSEAHPYFSTWQSESDDRGKTWTTPHKVVEYGAPPSVLVHSSGVLVMTYTHRHHPCGVRAVFSRDDGKTWSDEFIISDRCPFCDCGYPSSVELADGTILTVWYRQGGKDNGLEQAKWKLPEF